MAGPPPQCPHGISYAQPCYGCGWTCPACKRSYAPWVRECSYRHEDEEPFNLFGEYPVTPPASTATAMQFTLPPEWNVDGYQHLARVGGEWREVLPGLECRFNGSRDYITGSDGNYVIIRFRLTPADGSP